MLEWYDDEADECDWERPSESTELRLAFFCSRFRGVGRDCDAYSFGRGGGGLALVK